MKPLFSSSKSSRRANSAILPAPAMVVMSSFPSAVNSFGVISKRSAPAMACLRASARGLDLVADWFFGAAMAASGSHTPKPMTRACRRFFTDMGRPTREPGFAGEFKRALR
jgi:hypothetical protein